MGNGDKFSLVYSSHSHNGQLGKSVDGSPARAERSHNRGYGIGDLLSGTIELNEHAEALSAISPEIDIVNDARYFFY